MPIQLMKLTTIPGSCQGDTWTPDGKGGFPQIVRVDGATYTVFVCEDEDNPPYLPTARAAVAWLNGLNIQEGNRGTIKYVLEEGGMTWTKIENAKGEQAFTTEVEGWKYAIYRSGPYGWQVARLEHDTEDGEVICAHTPFLHIAKERAAEAEASRKEEPRATESELYMAVVHTEDAMEASYQAFKAQPSAENYRYLLGNVAEFQAAVLAYQAAVGKPWTS